MYNGNKIAGFTLGIFSILASFVVFLDPFIILLTLPASIVGLVLAIVGNKKDKSGFGTAAFVLSLVGLILVVVTFFTCGVCVYLDIVSQIVSDFI